MEASIAARLRAHPSVPDGLGSPERVEQKFFIAPRDGGLALALLRRTCRADPLYPKGQVNSLYFDTDDLEQYERSDAGEFAKDKVRIRWYGEELDPHRRSEEARLAPDAGEDRAGAGEERTETVWLELKSRRGFASMKQRISAEVSPTALAPANLTRGILPPGMLVETLAGFGFRAEGRLSPVVGISYWRYRFVEPLTGVRISLDSRIRSSMVRRGIGRGERGLELPGLVVEVKGPAFDLPGCLRPLAGLGSSWTRYSKYSSSLDAQGLGNGLVV